MVLSCSTPMILEYEVVTKKCHLPSLKAVNRSLVQDTYMNDKKWQCIHLPYHSC